MGKKKICPICERKIAINLELCKFCYTDLSMEKSLIPKRREEYKLERATTIFKEFINKKLQMGSNYYNPGRSEAEWERDDGIALTYLYEILKENPQSIAALKLSGEIFLERFDYTNGLEIFLNLVLIDPTNSEYWKTLALCYFKNLKYQKAIDAANTCLKYDPGNFDAYFILGESHRLLHNHNSAIECYKKVFKINPIHKEAAQNYVSIIKNTGTEQQKREWSNFLYQEVINLSPIELSNWEGKGVKFYNFGSVEHNIEVLQFKIDIFLDLNQFKLESINIFVMQQQLIVSMEDYPYAFKEFKKTFKIKPIKLGKKPLKLKDIFN
ncbi:MAG: tetratricopeptide repeat protein [Promethearchaeota archaeon]